MAKIKRNDLVVVIAGKNKGTSTHRVLRVLTDKNRVLVEGVNIVTKHKKPTQTQQGGIVKQEAPIHISNVMVVDSDGKPTRVGFSTESGKKTRIARSNGANIAEPKAK
ncbi:LSU ribosomal protein L24P [Bryocella elongata]|uniref:Large ribosomal subunit protein uL24 n=1 Tax=Bryocella elongata TaxID=863522 RepID=A0A1H6AM63_9BACT|nr:50S ribosomal protein L24 [Bryocella elongata]SEG49631.1 LSU ribosomal protein L24P [Bryocella elongata]